MLLILGDFNLLHKNIDSEKSREFGASCFVGGDVAPPHEDVLVPSYVDNYILSPKIETAVCH